MTWEEQLQTNNEIKKADRRAGRKWELQVEDVIITGKEYQIGMPYNFPSTILEANSSLRPITSSRLKELNITSNSSVILFSLFSFLLKE